MPAINTNRLRRCIDDTTDGNVTAFAAKIGVVHNTVKAWLAGTSQPRGRNLRKLLAHTGKPETYFYPDLAAYQQPDEDIGMPHRQQHEPDPMLYTWPEFARQDVTRVVDPENDKYLKMALAVLESADAGTRDALRSNIVKLYELEQLRKPRRKQGKK